MYAIVEIRGNQFKVASGEVIYVDGLYDIEPGKKVEFDKVLAVDDKFGTPYLKNALVTGIIEKHGKEKKVLVYKYKAKKNYSRTYGHRQKYTRVKITDIKCK